VRIDIGLRKADIMVTLIENRRSPMEHFPRQAERNRMVDAQIVARGVCHPGVLAALRKVPRHLFIPCDCQAQAYEDHPVRIACGQTVSQPYMVAIMTELLELAPTDRVLEIGTGSGYQTAILAQLAAEVVSIERHAPLADIARQRLMELEYSNVTILCGDGSLGYYERAPYNAILVTAGSPAIPAPLKEQLGENGRLLCPAGGRDFQRLIKVIRKANTYIESESISCIFVPLIGEEGWPAQ